MGGDDLLAPGKMRLLVDIDAFKLMTTIQNICFRNNIKIISEHQLLLIELPIEWLQWVAESENQQQGKLQMHDPSPFATTQGRLHDRGWRVWICIIAPSVGMK